MFAIRLICLIFLVAYSWEMGKGPTNAFGTLVSFSFVLAAPALYLLPTFEAWKKNHPDLKAIALVNIFLGWSLIGWVVSIVWAFKRPEPTPFLVSGSQRDRPTRMCPFCAEEILVAAVKCKHCGSNV